MEEDGRKLNEGFVETSKRKLTWTANDTVTFKMFHSSMHVSHSEAKEVFYLQLERDETISSRKRQREREKSIELFLEKQKEKSIKT